MAQMLLGFLSAGAGCCLLRAWCNTMILHVRSSGVCLAMQHDKFQATHHPPLHGIVLRSPERVRKIPAVLKKRRGSESSQSDSSQDDDKQSKNFRQLRPHSAADSHFAKDGPFQPCLAFTSFGFCVNCSHGVFDLTRLQPVGGRMR